MNPVRSTFSRVGLWQLAIIVIADGASCTPIGFQPDSGLFPLDMAPVDELPVDGATTDSGQIEPCLACCMGDDGGGATPRSNPDGGFQLSEAPDIVLPGIEPGGVAIDSVTGLAYLAAFASPTPTWAGGMLEVIDVNDGCVRASVPLPSPWQPVTVAVDNVDNLIFLVAVKAETSEVYLLAIDSITYTIVNYTTNSGLCTFSSMAIDEGLQRLYAFDGSVLVVIDIPSLSLIADPTIIIGGRAEGYVEGGISVDPASHEIYLTSPGGCFMTNTNCIPSLLTVVDGMSYSVLSQSSFSQQINGWFDPISGQYLLVTHDPSTTFPGTSTVRLGSTMFPIPSDVAIFSMSEPFGCGTTASHDWIAFGRDASLDLVALEFASDGTLERRTNFSGPTDLDMEPLATVSSGRFLVSVVVSGDDPMHGGDISHPDFLKRFKCY